VKGIIGIDAFALIAQNLNFTDQANSYHTIALKYAQQSMQMAFDTDHYKLVIQKICYKTNFTSEI
jgi:hypothetical protein